MRRETGGAGGRGCFARFLKGKSEHSARGLADEVLKGIIKSMTKSCRVSDMP